MHIVRTTLNYLFHYCHCIWLRNKFCWPTRFLKRRQLSATSVFLAKQFLYHSLLTASNPKEISMRISQRRTAHSHCYLLPDQIEWNFNKFINQLKWIHLIGSNNMQVANVNQVLCIRDGVRNRNGEKIAFTVSSNSDIFAVNLHILFGILKFRLSFKATPNSQRNRLEPTNKQTRASKLLVIRCNHECS